MWDGIAGDRGSIPWPEPSQRAFCWYILDNRASGNRDAGLDSTADLAGLGSGVLSHGRRAAEEGDRYWVLGAEAAGTRLSVLSLFGSDYLYR